MNADKILPDDPRLTAYALDEMSAGERAEFAQLLKKDVEAQAAVAEIREAGALFAQALKDEPVAMIEDAAVLGAAHGAAAEKRDGYAKKFVAFPYWKISASAAACFAIFFVYWQGMQDLKERKYYLEVPLAPPADPVERVVLGGSATSMPEGLVAQSQVLYDEKQPSFGQASSFTAATFSQSRQGVAGKPSGSLSYGVSEDWKNIVLAAGDGLPVRGGNEAYAYRKDSGYQRVADQPLSTFSVDVDTASYANVRRFLTQGQRPPADAVRIEELVNYFPYASYQAPVGPVPFATNLEVAGAPWAPDHRLVRIGLKGREVSDAARPAANLVFLLDVSDSMNQPNKLPLVQKSLRLLVEKLRPDDRVAIAVYAGSSGLALPSTPASRKSEILAAIDHLRAGGSTNGALGIHLAYDLAKANFIEGGVNRVILATDGDFNVGPTSDGELVRLIEEKTKTGVYLSVLGFGMGNLKDGTLEQLADKGNGHYAYIDTLQEARKTLVEQTGGTLVTIAKDVKLQVEFNPAVVQAYRLIGYENRLLAKEDFNNDAVDAGEIGAGHTVTALYEVVPVGVPMPGAVPAVDGLKYQTVQAASVGGITPGTNSQTPNVSEMLTVKVRYKEPAGDTSQALEFPLRDGGAAFAEASADFKFAASVAAFGMALRDSPHRGSLTLAEISEWARQGVNADAGGYRAEFLTLVDAAARVME